MDEHSESFNKEMDDIRKCQTEVTELKNIINELKIGLRGLTED